ncbi:hypothetical protein BLNAU_5905 [Blattamonas nauphoetae]|uniref:COP9 signalosome complex subunit 3 N-terminal helical repeats domain-containing protein n=1 Tax=Blattamonas nauphoetae TaxID=2049346 RepID=A0ABQ9Y5U0_9EUKA|nr:hypothetical protein BLNAU_5905 [Blattamonas nauphoetae]
MTYRSQFNPSLDQPSATPHGIAEFLNGIAENYQLLQKELSQLPIAIMHNLANIIELYQHLRYDTNPYAKFFVLTKILSENKASNDLLVELIDSLTVFAQFPMTRRVEARCFDFLFFEVAKIIFKKYEANNSTACFHIYNQLISLYSGRSEKASHIQLYFFLLCIKNKAYDRGYVIAQHSIYDCHPQTLTSREMQMVYYYAGVICAALKHFYPALMHFRMGLSLPVTPTNQIHYATFEKFQLVSLILDGREPDYPQKFNPTVILALLQTKSSVNTITNSIVTNPLNVSEAISLVEEHRQILQTCSCYGLAKQAVKAMEQRLLRRTLSTFEVCPFDKISIVTKDNTRHLEFIMRGIMDSDIDASIDMERDVIIVPHAKSVSFSLLAEKDAAQRIEHIMNILSEIQSQITESGHAARTNSYLLYKNTQHDD